MKFITFKYTKESHGLAIELFERVILCLHHGVPGDWFFTEEFDDMKLYYPLGMTVGRSDDGYHIAFYCLIFLFHIGWIRGVTNA